MEYETLLRVNELAEIIKLHSQALTKLERFRKAYPYLVAPNVLQLIEDNLRDNTMVLSRELSQLHSGGQTPAGDPSRFVCKRCHMKFAIPLPGGICDECRSKA
jgi:L-lysine 2,3-aminomutase